MITNEYLERIKEGKIEIKKGNAKEFYSEGIVLDNEETIQADMIVSGSGYVAEYKFLSNEIKKILQYDDNSVLLSVILYRGMLHPQLPRLCFIGNFTSSVPGRFELQAEVGIRYLTERLLISTDELWEGVRTEEIIKNTDPKLYEPYSHPAHLAETMRLLEIELDFEFIKNELEFSNGPLLPQFFWLERPGQIDLAKMAIQELREKHPYQAEFFS